MENGHSGRLANGKAQTLSSPQAVLGGEERVIGEVLRLVELAVV